MARISIDTRAARRVFGDAVSFEADRIPNRANGAVAAATEDLKLAVRDRVKRAFSGGQSFSPSTPRDPARLARTVRSQVFGPKSRRGAAGWIYSVFGRNEADGFKDFFAPFVRGATLGARRGKWLYLPIEAEERKNRRRRGRAAEIDKTLKLVPSKDGQKIYLIRKDGRKNVLVAMLVKQVTIPQTLSLAGLNAAETLDRKLKAALK